MYLKFFQFQNEKKKKKERKKEKKNSGKQFDAVDIFAIFFGFEITRLIFRVCHGVKERYVISIFGVASPDINFEGLHIFISRFIITSIARILDSLVFYLS